MNKNRPNTGAVSKDTVNAVANAAAANQGTADSSTNGPATAPPPPLPVTNTQEEEPKMNSKWITLPASKLGRLDKLKDATGKEKWENTVEHNQGRRLACDGIDSPRVYFNLKLPIRVNGSKYVNIPMGHKKRGYRDWHYFDIGRKRGDGYGCPRPKAIDADIPQWVRDSVANEGVELSS